MRQRLPIALSATALVVSLLGATPLGNAAEKALRRIPPFATKAGYANKAGIAVNANKLNGHASSTNPGAGSIPVVGSNGRLPASIGAVGPQGKPGKNGATRVTVVSATSRSQGAFVYCPAGDVATGGGSYGGTAITNRPLPDVSGATPTGWAATLSNSGSPQTIYVYAICASP